MARDGVGDSPFQGYGLQLLGKVGGRVHMRNREGKRMPVDLTWTSTRTHKRNGGHTVSTEQGS